MNKNLNDKKIEVFKALANSVRLDIIYLLLDGEKCVCEIQQELHKYEQPHISKGLSKLKSVGLIQSRKEGTNVFYSLSICCMKDFFACLDKILNNSQDIEK